MQSPMSTGYSMKGRLVRPPRKNPRVKFLSQSSNNLPIVETMGKRKSITPHRSRSQREKLCGVKKLSKSISLVFLLLMIDHSLKTWQVRREKSYIPVTRHMIISALVCFEYFRSKCDLKDAIDENKAILKEKMKEAQMHGERANKSRNAITYLKKNIETIRRER